MSEGTGKKGTELITIGGNNLPELDQLKPQHFEALEGILDRLHQYQYRHVAQVGWVSLFSWVSGMISLWVFYESYIRALVWHKVLGETVGFLVFIGLGVGALCIFSRCFTRLFHFKTSVVRISQFLIWVCLFEFATPAFLHLYPYLPHFEYFLFAVWYLLIASLLYWTVDALITFKWLRVVRSSYLGLAILVLCLVLYFDRIRHFVIGDNDVMVYSDFGSGKAKSVDSVDALVDQIVKKLD